MSGPRCLPDATPGHGLAVARYRIFSLIDMHQMSTTRPSAAKGTELGVCTDGVAPTRDGMWPTGVSTTPGRGGQAYGHFWDNNVVGNSRAVRRGVTKCGAVPRRSWVVGYDPFNEPYGGGLDQQPNNPAFDALLECFYTGGPPRLNQSGSGSPAADDPERG